MLCSVDDRPRGDSMAKKDDVIAATTGVDSLVRMRKKPRWWGQGWPGSRSSGAVFTLPVLARREDGELPLSLSLVVGSFACLDHPAS